LKGERLDFQMRDGVRIQGDYYEGVTDKAVILAHMSGKDRTSFDPLIPALQTKGWHVLNVDLRGHGQSAGNLASFTKKDFEAIPVDLVALSEWLKSKNPSMRVSIIGADFGANAGLYAASLSESFASVVAISPANTINGVAITSTIARLRIPVLYLAAKDDLISHQQTRTLYSETGSRPNEKQFLEFASGGHGTDLLFSSTEPASEIVSFIDSF
jgi:alpha-beta hydrolase superfamily lysophospholipase